MKQRIQTTLKAQGVIFTAVKRGVKRRRPGSKFAELCAVFFIAAFSLIVLSLSVRGLPGTPNAKELNTQYWTTNGPFELSPERGRYALLYSFIEDHSLQFTLDLAKFTSPDNAITKDGKYVSLFAPGVSFLLIPGYLIGKQFSDGQVGASMVIVLFAVLNLLLIRAIAIRLGASSIAGTIGGFVFVFATPAFTYAVSIYQHHISTFLILLSIYIMLRFKGIWSLSTIWFLCALGVAIDYPNFFFLLPIGIYSLSRIVFVEKTQKAYLLKFRPAGLLTFLTAVIPVFLFLTYNQLAYGNPLQLAGTLQTVQQAASTKTDKAVLAGVDPEQKKATAAVPADAKQNAIAFFRSRLLLSGFYTLFLSPDRGVLFYTPVILFGLVGISFALKSNQPIHALLIAIIGSNVLLYGMWDDPYGGWAFGGRYLIPSYSLMAIFIALALTKLKRNSLFAVLFFTVFAFSVAINTLGAITSSRNPPEVEAVALEKVTHQSEPYTVQRNFNYLLTTGTKSFAYRVYFSHLTDPFDYYYLLTITIIVTSGVILAGLKLGKTERHEL